MAKEHFLTLRWNNALTLGLGIPTLVFGLIVLSTSVLSNLAGFIGIVIVGVLY